MLARCVTCRDELLPERAERYDYCMKPGCQMKNARPLTVVSVGVNKASDQYVVLDDQTRNEMASGRYRDPGRTSSGRLGRGRPRTASGPRWSEAPARTEGREEALESWTRAEQNLALAYEVTGRLPLIEIAKRLGRDERTVAKMLVAAKARWKR
jgi:hypothetical protein